MAQIEPMGTSRERITLFVNGDNDSAQNAR